MAELNCSKKHVNLTVWQEKVIFAFGEDDLSVKERRKQKTNSIKLEFI